MKCAPHSTAAMKLIAKYFAPMGAMMKGAAPYNADIVARNAGFVETLSKMPWDGFVASTKDVKSATLPAAYSEPAKFKEAEDKLLAETAKLVAVTKSGDEAAIKALPGDLQKQMDRLQQLVKERIPALQKSLEAAGVATPKGHH